MARYVLSRPVDGQRLPVDEHQHHGDARGVERLEQLLLASGKLERGARMALAHALVVLAQHGDDHVAACGLFHRFVDAGPARRP